MARLWDQYSLKVPFQVVASLQEADYLEFWVLESEVISGISWDRVKLSNINWRRKLHFVKFKSNETHNEYQQTRNRHKINF